MNHESLLVPVVKAMERSRSGRMALRHWRKFTRPYDPTKSRVLCVGFAKTGTSSFGLAMRHLGYSHFGYDRDFHNRMEAGNIDSCLDWASHFNALDDLPWSTPRFIAAFCQRFPGSYYVQLERDEQQWLKSYFNYFGQICSAAEALERLHSHREQVKTILRDEPHQLQMNICAGDGFEKLCPFLNIPVLDQPFPWVIPRR